MHHFNEFITAIRTLDVRTKERFIDKNGNFIHPIQGDPKLNPGLRAIYNTATVLDLDHYYDKKKEDNYDDFLMQLRELALSDIRLLPTDAQIKRQLDGVVKLRERFRKLARTTAKAQVDYYAEEFEESLFFELKIYGAFINTRRPSATIDGDTLLNLNDCVGLKLKHIMALVDDIAEILGIPTPPKAPIESVKVVDTETQLVSTLSTGQLAQPTVSTKTAACLGIEEKKTIARNRIKVFSGNTVTGRKIMKDEEFERLVQYVNYLIEHDAVMEGIKPIAQTGLSSKFIKYTFYLLHEELYTTNSIRPYFIDFLHAVFMQFNGTSPSTTKTKFSEKPTSYEQDLAVMSR